ncbi:MAG: helix-turn-helix transcriptional regulator [Tissierellia bacterium]|nr:helix-turn-helix transcriptional regulator [Tissierellia bacterium]
MSLGKRIGEARKSKNLTQEALSEKLGVTRQNSKIGR